MVDYVELVPYAELLHKVICYKQEYDSAFEWWLDTIDGKHGDAGKTELLFLFADALKRLEQLDRACLDLHNTTKRLAERPKDMVVLS